MKTGIHPTYTHQATITCTTCGTVYPTGSTVADIRVEVCAHCHPFYTGKQNIVDTAGRVDRFKRIAAKTTEVKRPVRSKRAKLQAKEARRTPKAAEK